MKPILELLDQNMWVGVVIVIFIVAFLVKNNFKDRIKCPECGSKNIVSQYAGTWDYNCSDCGRSFSPNY